MIILIHTFHHYILNLQRFILNKLMHKVLIYLILIYQNIYLKIISLIMEVSHIYMDLKLQLSIQNLKMH